MKKIFVFCTTLFFFYSAFAQKPVQPAGMCGPIPPVCTPTSVNTGGFGLGITNFQIGQISNTSTNNSTVGYQDFTCTDSTSLNQGDSYPVEVITGQTYAEVIRAWIDFNNDGSFDSTELIFGDLPTVYSHNGYAFIPVTGQLGIPLRLRVGSEVDLYPPPDGCNDVQYGQYEDYTVYLNGPTGIDQIKNKNSVSISPNPFHAEACLGIRNLESGCGKCELRIYNTMGDLVREEEIPIINSYILHRAGLIDGLYFYELTTTDYQLLGTGKFIIE